MLIKLLCMRTTIELTDQQRAKLLKLAAERGEKGFSRLIQEAVDRYLDDRLARKDRIAAARAVLGTMDDQVADALEASVKAIREQWR